MRAFTLKKGSCERSSFSAANPKDSSQQERGQQIHPTSEPFTCCLFIYLFPLIPYLFYLDVIKGSLLGGGGAATEWQI